MNPQMQMPMMNMPMGGMMPQMMQMPMMGGMMPQMMNGGMMMPQGMPMQGMPMMGGMMPMPMMMCKMTCKMTATRDGLRDDADGRHVAGNVHGILQAHDGDDAGRHADDDGVRRMMMMGAMA